MTVTAKLRIHLFLRIYAALLYVIVGDVKGCALSGKVCFRTLTWLGQLKL